MANPVKSRLLLGGVLLLSSQLLAQTIKVKAPTGTVQAAILKVASDRKLPIVSANPSQIVLADDVRSMPSTSNCSGPKVPTSSIVAGGTTSAALSLGSGLRELTQFRATLSSFLRK
jgi:hypothetical protein